MELPDNCFGVRIENNGVFIGNLPVVVKCDNITIADQNIELTDGLRELLWKKRPVNYSLEDLSKYKQILTLSNCHKQNFDKNCQIKSSCNWKYVNIISKLFLSNKSKTKKQKGIN